MFLKDLIQLVVNTFLHDMCYKQKSVLNHKSEVKKKQEQSKHGPLKKKTEVRSDVLEELASFANRSQTMVFFVEWSKTEKSFDN